MKKLLSVILSFTMIFSMSVTAFAHESTTAKAIQDTKEIKFSLNDINENDKAFLNKMSQVFDGYITNKSGAIEFTYNDEQLSNICFTQSEIIKLTEINNTVCGTVLSKEPNSPIYTKMFVEGGKIYFDNVDVQAFLFAAASVGPQALYSALVALGSTLGPVGTAIAAVVGIIGAPSLASFCYYIIQAAYYDQGVYIGIEMNGIFPNIVSGTW